MIFAKNIILLPFVKGNVCLFKGVMSLTGLALYIFCPDFGFALSLGFIFGLYRLSRRKHKHDKKLFVGLEHLSFQRLLDISIKLIYLC